MILLIDDDDALRAALVDSFAIAGLEVEAFADAASALARVRPDFPGIVVTDIRMPRMDGHAVFEAVSARDGEIPVLLMTGHGDVAMAVAAMRGGAFDFIAKPFAADHLIASVRRALETRRLVLENRRLRASVEAAEEDYPLIGTTPAMDALRDKLRQLAQIDVDLLIEGETGTGKELAARQLHRWSKRRNHGFVSVDCAALPDHLVDEILFGTRGSGGRIAEADRGTLFLDEIDSMSSAMQGKLLRVIEERELPANGREPPRVVNLRVIAAAKSNLADEVASGRFREDLLYRLETIRLRIPPLRERRADVPMLFAWFLRDAATQYDRPVPAITAEVEARLMTDPWRGNVRALRNFAVQTVLALARDDQDGGSLSLTERLARLEAAMIAEALQQAGGDVAATAEALGLPRRSLYDRLQRHGIDASSFRRREGDVA
ncbi:Fis family transcriptional regulator [Sphingomonas sp. Leaf24]|uniref:sigma-54-dependent transcriptional regulator n=1 Tax=unclassified Sphingomonas TaxID=196159 RepID=UPI0006FDF9CC|nr:MULTISPECIES: sigma-54 dependent transcriptional regulator [unclassified Sphingomonas]KQM22549.1 Fis family transcriptional regulator [Sphingomonas sp. Leaf5]KQM94244.1 Fis family transcriptional regulator [Sphingomonas sp. Leaf24]